MNKIGGSRRALEMCRDMWTWMAEHPGAEKHEWPWWELWTSPAHPMGWCPCCQWARVESANGTCEACPIPCTSWLPTCSSDEIFACATKGSPYDRWGMKMALLASAVRAGRQEAIDAALYDVAESARAVAGLAVAALEEMDRRIEERGQREEGEAQDSEE